MMQAVLMKAEQAQDILHKAVDRMQDLGAEFSDARSQTVRVTGVSSMNGDIRQLVQKSTGGVCLRAWAGGRWGYGTATSFDREDVMRAAEQAVRNASGERKSDLMLEPATVREHRRADVRIHPDSVDLSEKIATAQDLDRAQAVDDRIINRVGSYSEEVKTNALVNSAGSDLSWEEVRTDADLEELGRVTAREAIETLKADRAPSGNLTVISDPMVSGLLAHEAMGHASEGDEITKRRSFLTGDEGTPSSCTTIIDHGVYQGYMHSLETASQLGVRPTGNGRAENYGKRVWVRMTNTYFGPGEWDRDEIIADTRDGILCDKMVNGMEDPVGGCFEAKCLRGFLIRNGEIVKPLQSFTLTGRSVDILSSADALSKEVVLDGGMCGKGIEDWVRVSSGGPYMRARMIVGGGQ